MKTNYPNENSAENLPTNEAAQDALDQGSEDYRGAYIQPFIDDDGSLQYSVYAGDTGFHTDTLEQAREGVDEECKLLGVQDLNEETEDDSE